MKTQLLCTFAHRSDVNIISEYIKTSFEIPERRIFIFENSDDVSKLYCTYNIQPTRVKAINTISVHRKKETNTLYTVNALNEIIQRINNGVLDKTYQLEWHNYRNSLLLTDDNAGYRIIELNMYKKVTW